MFKIIQSHRTENLVDELLVEYQSVQQSIFDPFVVIVPSMVLGDWLDKTIASRAGISTLVMTKFWGQYPVDTDARCTQSAQCLSIEK